MHIMKRVIGESVIWGISTLFSEEDPDGLISLVSDPKAALR